MALPHPFLSPNPVGFRTLDTQRFAAVNIHEYDSHCIPWRREETVVYIMGYGNISVIQHYQYCTLYWFKDSRMQQRQSAGNTNAVHSLGSMTMAQTFWCWIQYGFSECRSSCFSISAISASVVPYVDSKAVTLLSATVITNAGDSTTYKEKDVPYLNSWTVILPSATAILIKLFLHNVFKNIDNCSQLFVTLPTANPAIALS